MSMLGILAAAILIGLAGAPGHPPSPVEQQAFEDGSRLLERGDPAGAARAWRAGYAAGHDPAFLVHIGEAEEKAGSPERAGQAYAQYLRESPDAADRGDIEGRIRRLAPAMPPARRFADGAETTGSLAGPGGTAPAVIAPPAAGEPAAPGPTASAPSGQPPSRPQASDAGDDPREDLRPIVDESQAGRSRLNTIAWVSAGVTALLLGVAAFYGASAADKASDANRLLSYADPTTGVPLGYGASAQQFESDVSVGQHDDRVAKGFVITAGVTALVTAALFAVDSASSPATPGARASAGRDHRTALAPVGLIQGRRLGLGWTF